MKDGEFSGTGGLTRDWVKVFMWGNGSPESEAWRGIGAGEKNSQPRSSLLDSINWSGPTGRGPTDPEPAA